MRLGDRRLRRRIGALRRRGLIRRQAQTTRKHLHSRRETLVEGRRTIIGRGEALVERRGRIKGETFVERRAPARRSLRRRGSSVGQAIQESDNRFQACQAYAIVRRAGSQRGAEPEKLRVDCAENGNMRSGQCRVCRPCLRACRFKGKPQNYRGDSKRNPADPRLSQYVPQRVPPLPVAERPTATRVPRRTRKETCRLRQEWFRPIRS